MSVDMRLSCIRAAKLSMSASEKMLADMAAYDAMLNFCEPQDAELGACNGGFVHRAAMGHCLILILFFLMLLVYWTILAVWKPIWDLVFAYCHNSLADMQCFISILRYFAILPFGYSTCFHTTRCCDV